jgi:integrase
MRQEGWDVEGGLIFCDSQGGYLRQSNVLRSSFAPALKLAGLAGKGIRPYDMRHTSATLLLLEGVNVKVVSQRLGHESIEITLKHYAHCLPTMQEAAAEAVGRLFGDCPTVVPQTAESALVFQAQVKAG